MVSYATNIPPTIWADYVLELKSILVTEAGAGGDIEGYVPAANIHAHEAEAGSPEQVASSWVQITVLQPLRRDRPLVSRYDVMELMVLVETGRVDSTDTPRARLQAVHAAIAGTLPGRRTLPSKPIALPIERVDDTVSPAFDESTRTYYASNLYRLAVSR